MDSIQWNWKNGFCKKHAGQPAPCPVCIETFDNDLVRESVLEDLKAAFMLGVAWKGILTKAETIAFEAFKEAAVPGMVRPEVLIQPITIKDLDMKLGKSEDYLRATLDFMPLREICIPQSSDGHYYIRGGPGAVSLEEWSTAETEKNSVLANAYVVWAHSFYPEADLEELARIAFFEERKRPLTIQVVEALSEETNKARSILVASLQRNSNRARYKDGLVEYEGLQSVNYDFSNNQLDVEFRTMDQIAGDRDAKPSF